MKRKYLISLLAIMVVVLAASSSMSIAWYATTSVLNIDGINITLTGSSSLLIGTENKRESFKDHLEYSDLKQVYAFEAVSAMKHDDWFSKQEKNPTLYAQYKKLATQLITTDTNTYALPYEKPATEGFYQQELFLYAENDYYAIINTDESYFKPNEKTNYERAVKLSQTSEVGKPVQQIFDELNSLANCLRFSILVDEENCYNYQIFDPNKNDDTVWGGLLDIDLLGTYDTCTDGEDKYETLYGEVNDRNLLRYRKENNPSFTGKHTWFNSGHDVDAYQVDFDASYANGLTIAKEDAISTDEYKILKDKIINGQATREEKDSFFVIPLKAGVATRIVLSIYLEGWDKDNINDTMSASFLSSLVFNVIDKKVL